MMSLIPYTRHQQKQTLLYIRIKVRIVHTTDEVFTQGPFCSVRLDATEYLNDVFAKFWIERTPHYITLNQGSKIKQIVNLSLLEKPLVQRHLKLTMVIKKILRITIQGQLKTQNTRAVEDSNSEVLEEL